MKHGEQLAPLIAGCSGGAGIVPPGPHRDRGRRRARARSPACGSGWSPRARSASSSRSRSTACARSTCSPSRPSTTGRSTADFVVATDARRKEVYWATYDERRRAARRPGRRPAGRAGDRAPVVGEGALLYPEAFPTPPGRPGPTPAGWPARRRGAGRAARPRAALPAPPRRRAPGAPEAGLVMTVRRGHRDDLAAVPRSRPTPRRGRLVGGPGRARAWPAGCRRCTTSSPRSDGAVVGSRRGEPGRRHRRAPADRRRRRRAGDRRRPGRCSRRCVELAGRTARPTGCCWRCARTTPAALAFYAAQRVREIDRRRGYYRDGSTAVVMRLAARRRAAGRGS